MAETFLYNGNSKEILSGMELNSIDSCVTDPPYELVSIVKRFGKSNSAPAKFGNDGRYSRLSKGFMGKTWDGTGIVKDVEFWKKVYDVLKPGAFLVAFSGTRTYHRMVVAIEDAGFEIRDMLGWIYFQGFPKGLDISKQIDKHLGYERTVLGYRKDLLNSGSGITNFNDGKSDFSIIEITEPASDEAKMWDGWNTALKPAIEPIVLARKPISENSVAENVLRWGTGALNIDACRIQGETVPINKLKGWTGFGQIDRPEYEQVKNTKGRWPANLILEDGYFGEYSKYFYCPKASPSERGDNKHPTVKPVLLMKYLIKLVTRDGGTVLDPFMGSGTTGVACKELNNNFIGIELEKPYFEYAKKRLENE